MSSQLCLYSAARTRDLTLANISFSLPLAICLQYRSCTYPCSKPDYCHMIRYFKIQPSISANYHYAFTVFCSIRLRHAIACRYMHTQSLAAIRHAFIVSNHRTALTESFIVQRSSTASLQHSHTSQLSLLCSTPSEVANTSPL
jgi:hypothetical protein